MLCQQIEEASQEETTEYCLKEKISRILGSKRRTSRSTTYTNMYIIIVVRIHYQTDRGPIIGPVEKVGVTAGETS